MKVLFGQYAYWKVLSHFALHPSQEAYVKQLSRELDLSAGTSSNALKDLESRGFLERRDLGQAAYYRLADNPLTTELKRFVGLFRIFRSGLVETLIDQVPELVTVALYGSYVKGDFNEDSDVDILLVGQKKVKGIELGDIEGGVKAEVNVVQFSIGQWLKLRTENDPYYQEVRKDHIVLHGAELA